MTLDTQETGRRELASAAKRLRVAATSDPQRADDLADALVELTGSRLLAWDFTEAATDAPESVVLAARILASRGPSGPYASLRDAVRYFGATAQLAAVQAGLGQPEAAGRTLDGLDAWRQQVSRLPLAENLPDAIVLWAHLARARSLLADDVALANAWADAAELRLHTLPSPPAYLALATHLLVADCRWAAGRPESSLAHHRLALDAYQTALAGLGTQPRPAVARIAAAPVVALYEPYAQRLAATGDTVSGIAVRRAEVALLESLADREFLAAARAGLADALAADGRSAEAEAARSAAGPVPPGPPPGPVRAPTPAERITWESLPPSLTLAVGDSREAAGRWQQAEQAAVFAGVAARAEAERTEGGLRARAEADAAQRAAETEAAEQQAAAQAAAAEAERIATERQDAELAALRAEREEAAARVAAEERRRQLAEAHRPNVDPDAAQAAAAELDLARAAVQDAGDNLTRQAAAQEWLAAVLRPLAAVDPSRRPELAESLDALVRLRWRLGDAEGSRAAAREAKGVGGAS